MPYKSKLQARYMHFLKEKGRLPESIDLKEYDKKTDFENLPEEKMFSGGMAEEYPEHEEEHFEHLNDDPEWNEHDENTSGSPGKGYADGGIVEENMDEMKSHFAKALMRKRQMKMGGMK